jgi:hypothetical protein
MKIPSIKENASHRRQFENLFVVKGWCHKVNIFYKIQIPSVHADVFFTIFWFLVDEKIRLKVLLSPLRLLTGRPLSF